MGTETKSPVIKAGDNSAKINFVINAVDAMLVSAAVSAENKVLKRTLICLRNLLVVYKNNQQKFNMAAELVAILLTIKDLLSKSKHFKSEYSDLIEDMIMVLIKKK